MISFDNASKTFPDGTTAVQGLSLDIAEGSFTVFVGPSGCGKTTSMRMVNKMVEPSSGRVLVNGRDVAGLPPVEHRLGIGYVMQQAGLLPHRSVLDNVAQVLRLKGVPKREARARAMAAIELVQLRPELIHRFPAQLSGGQQQRVGVARALAADPPILLMDEPFSAVDPVVRDELQVEILRLHRELGKTILFVTHDIDEALRLGDHIAVFAPGGVVEQYASPETVLTRPANALVESMVGRDRGFRALSFQDGASLRMTPIGGESGGSREAGGGSGSGSGPREVRASSDWRLELDAAGAPVAWIDAAGARSGPGSTVPPGGSLRAILDSVLSSPSPFGICVDASGAATGLLAEPDVYALLESRHLDQP
ncbi:ABC transporter ATP-binding protein [Leucobacter luti]|uniref:ABC transporter ATP-binding protein n=1 Tax=Leucobacter luti TaxID=340320 RepID=UPI003D016E9F